MKMNVYNIVWADDEIDELLDSETIDELESKGFKIVGQAHDGEELKKLLRQPEMIDAVIVDANFNESDVEIGSERDTSGLDYARGLYLHDLKQSIPFFLFTNRSDEMLRDIYKHNPKFLEDFPRHKRWFNKSGQGEYDEMFEAIKQTIEEYKSPSFIVRNRYQYELNAASLFNGTDEFIFDFLLRDYNNTLEEIKEPFVSVRRSIEKIFGQCEKLNLIPPVSDNTNGTAAYFLHNKYRVKDSSNKSLYPYVMLGGDIMDKPLAKALNYIVDITQDGSHSKNEMKLKVDEYFEQTKDTLLLRSVVYILIDLIKWFAKTAINHQDIEVNELTLWKKIEIETNFITSVQNGCTNE